MSVFRSSFERWIAIGFLVGAATLSTVVVSLPFAVELSLEMAASQPSHAQLFLNTGHGFTEEESIHFDVDSHSLHDFRTVHLSLPRKPILDWRLDPADSTGTFAIRNFALTVAGSRPTSLHMAEARAFNQIAQIRQLGNELRVVTTEAATDPGIEMQLSPPVNVGAALHKQNALRLLIANGSLLFLFLLIRRFPGFAVVSLTRARLVGRRWNAPFQAFATKLSDDDFIRFDAPALWIYLFCLLSFLGAVAANLNGSSSQVMHDMFHRGGTATMLFGKGRAIRSDEWGYATPDVLSQAYRTNRFEAGDSDLGGHSAALLGNLPVRHVTTLLRPQFWGFFFLPPEYGYAFFWQSKAFLLVVGVFSWLLWLSGSTRWALTGALWFLFSPAIQWAYSWPSGLPEMIGLSCLATVAFAYLLVGRSRTALLIAGVVAVGSAVDFLMCSYLPQMVPLAWVQIASLGGWCWGMRRRLADEEGRRYRLIGVATCMLSFALFAGLLFLDLHQATTAISNTAYPGRRIVSGGTVPRLELVSHLLPWTQSEDHFPALMGNVSEGSGFLWLAPFTLLCLPQVIFSRPRRALLLALWVCFFVLGAWLILPLPAALGAPLGLNRTFGGRAIPALGLANIGIVSLCLSYHRFNGSRRFSTWMLRLCLMTVAMAFFFWTFREANAGLGQFYSPKTMFWGSVFLAFTVTLMIASRHYLLCLVLVASQALFFGGINPVQRGVHVYSQSALFRFVHKDPALTRGRWMIYTDQPTLSGLFAGAGCEIYTGTRYLPDIDHFPLFAARGLDTQTFNRLGYLLVTLPDGDAGTQAQLINPVVVDWKISPRDPLLKQIGIQYVAFDAASEMPSPAIASRLIPLADQPVDNFWLYRLP